MPEDHDAAETGGAPMGDAESDHEADSGWPLLSDLDLGVCLASPPQERGSGVARVEQ